MGVSLWLPRSSARAGDGLALAVQVREGPWHARVAVDAEAGAALRSVVVVAHDGAALAPRRRAVQERRPPEPHALVPLGRFQRACSLGARPTRAAVWFFSQSVRGRVFL